MQRSGGNGSNMDVPVTFQVLIVLVYHWSRYPLISKTQSGPELAASDCRSLSLFHLQTTVMSASQLTLAPFDHAISPFLPKTVPTPSYFARNGYLLVFSDSSSEQFSYTPLSLCYIHRTRCLGSALQSCRGGISSSENECTKSFSSEDTDAHHYLNPAQRAVIDVVAGARCTITERGGCTPGFPCTGSCKRCEGLDSLGLESLNNSMCEESNLANPKPSSLVTLTLGVQYQGSLESFTPARHVADIGLENGANNLRTTCR